MTRDDDDPVTLPDVVCVGTAPLALRVVVSTERVG